MKHIHLLILCLAVIACNGGGSANDAGYPSDVVFDERNLPAINDADFAEAKSVAKSMSQPGEISSQLLLDKDESTGDKQRRERKLQKLNSDIQTLVREWQTTCPSQHTKTGDDLKNKQPVSGQTYRTDENKLTTGATCPVSFTQIVSSVIQVEKFAPSPLSYSASFNATGTFNGKINQPEHQQKVGATGMTLNLRVNGRFDGEGTTQNSFHRAIGDGSMETLAHGLVKFTMTNSNLNRGQEAKELFTFNFDKSGKVFVYTQFRTSHDDGRTNVTRYFIGNRELTLQDVQAMGEFPFITDSESQKIGRGMMSL